MATNIKFNTHAEFDEDIKVADKPSYCYGCGKTLKSYSVLICIDCLDYECEHFFKTASQLQEEI